MIENMKFLLSANAIQAHLLCLTLIVLLSVSLWSGDAQPDYALGLVFTVVAYPVLLFLIWWSQKMDGVSGAETVAHQPPGKIFPWPKDIALTAIDEVVLAVPADLLDPDRPMGECIAGPDDMEFSAPPGSDVVLLRLKPGMSVRLSKTVEAFVYAADDRPRRIQALPIGGGESAATR
jgi:hypothetical protein